MTHCKVEYAKWHKKSEDTSEISREEVVRKVGTVREGVGMWEAFEIDLRQGDVQTKDLRFAGRGDELVPELWALSNCSRMRT